MLVRHSSCSSWDLSSVIEWGALAECPFGNAGLMQESYLLEACDLQPYGQAVK